MADAIASLAFANSIHLGPILGGASYIPWEFRSMLSPSAYLFEMARDLSTWFSIHSRAFRDCSHNAAVILAANGETENLLLPFRGDGPAFDSDRFLACEKVSDSAARFKTRVIPNPCVCSLAEV